MPGFTHDGLQEDLADHLRGNTSRMVWTNTQLGPAGSPRPDVFTIDKSYSRFCSDCYEIKVSMSDLRSDITSGKWQKYLQFGSRVWFAFERGLAPLDLIPKECGVILRGPGGWRASRKPVAQALRTLPHDTWMKLLIEAHPDWLQQASSPRIRGAHDATIDKVIRKKLGAEVAELFSNVRNAEMVLKYRQERAQQQEAQLVEDRARRESEHKARMQQHMVALNADMVALAELLGVPRDQANVHTLSGAIGRFRSALRGADLERAMVALQALSGTLDTKPWKNPEVFLG